MTATIVHTPIELVLAFADICVGAGELPGKANDGPWVRRVQQTTGNQPPDPWCASFVARVGHRALGTRWPAPLTASCAQLGAWATREGVLMDAPAVGDILLIYYPAPAYRRFAHTGFVEKVLPDGRVQTIEGNTNEDGSREGWLVCRKTRRLGAQDRFVRWAGLVR